MIDIFAKLYKMVKAYRIKQTRRLNINKLLTENQHYNCIIQPAWHIDVHSRFYIDV